MNKESFPEFKQSGINRVVNTDAAGEARGLEMFKKKLTEPGGTKSERWFSPEMMSVFKQINELMPEFVRSYGGVPLVVPPEKVKVINIAENPNLRVVSKTSEGTTAFKAGEYDAANQEAKLFIRTTGDVREGRVQIAHLAVHEVIHFNSFQSATAFSQDRLAEKDPSWANTEYPYFYTGEDGKKFHLFRRRQGLNVVVYKDRGDAFHFHDIDEAVTEELAKRFAELYFPRIPELKKGLANLKELIHQKIEKGKKNFSVDEASGVVWKRDSTTGKYKWRLSFYAYQKERERLRKLIDDIYEANREKFTSKEDIFKLFATATMSGKLLELGRLIEGTYGKGSFRELGEKTKK